eukprot:TRINITY_DN498_c1_g3_i1.p1 TRINITY_DN498_c1_g3~~TRINITY_DN498_c1_g3_i1.p1  ORF type:complete len:349 (+),score=96.92 TRINITY_DN498_c1_g3_i1:76-1122(+)
MAVPQQYVLLPQQGLMQPMMQPATNFMSAQVLPQAVPQQHVFVTPGAAGIAPQQLMVGQTQQPALHYYMPPVTYDGQQHAQQTVFLAPVQIVDTPPTPPDTGSEASTTKKGSPPSRKAHAKSHYLSSALNSRPTVASGAQEHAVPVPAPPIASGADAVIHLRPDAEMDIEDLVAMLRDQLSASGGVDLKAVGPTRVATAMQALAICQSQLEAMDAAVMIQPAFQHSQGAPSGMQAMELKVMLRPQDVTWPAATRTRTVIVNQWSVTRKVAGAAANVARSAAAAPAARCQAFLKVSCGSNVASINTGVRALALARAMLEADDLDFIIAPVPPVDKDAVVLALILSKAAK